jgi:hypothetical protein
MRRPKHKQLQKTTCSCLYVCEHCGTQERIPTEVLAFFDVVDPGEPDQPATFQCQQCPGIMYPQHYLRAKRVTP